MAQENSNERHLRLSDPSINFAQKLKLAISYELEYWEQRQNPPNIPMASFKTMVQFIPENIMPRWTPRKSIAGTHGTTGEDSVFNFEFDLHTFTGTATIYCKGYFFDRGDLKGATIQSFRAVNNNGKVYNFKRKS